MKFIFTLFFTLLLSFVFADIAGKIEYDLPIEAKNWELGKKLENERGITLIYFPKKIEDPHTKEFFGITFYTLPTNNDIFSVKQTLSKMFPNMEIDFHVLEKMQDGAIYEWAAKDNAVEKLHGWGRAFSLPDGAAVLNYQTENTDELAKSRSIWLPVLRNAQILQ